MDIESCRSKVRPILSQLGQRTILDIQADLIPHMREFLDDCYGDGLDTDEAFNRWNVMMAELVDELGLRRH